MDRLHAMGYIFDPKSKARSVVVSCKACSDPASCSRNTSGRMNRKRASGRLRGESSRAIPKRPEATGGDHSPSSLVPQRTRNALRLRFAPGR